MVTQDSSGSGTSQSSHSLLRMRDVVSRFSVCETSIRRATASGALKCLTLPSGHRRFREYDVLTWLGQDYAEEKGSDGEIPIAAVVRVSSSNQNRRVGSSDKSSMEYQQDRVQTYINQRWDARTKVTWYKRVSSGMNFEAPEFLQLIGDILDGKFRGGVIVATDFTRVCRFGIKLVEHICKLGGCEIEYTLDRDDKDENESLTDDILSILTHFTAKASGKKQKEINGVRMDEEQLRDAYLWHKSGMTYRGIAARLSREKRDTDFKGRKITRSVIYKRLQENWNALSNLYPEGPIEPSSFDAFVSKHIKKAGEKARLRRKEVIAAYKSFCAESGLAPISSRKIKVSTESMNWKSVFDNDGLVAYCGLKLQATMGA